jgi:hypothetical protein
MIAVEARIVPKPVTDPALTLNVLPAAAVAAPTTEVEAASARCAYEVTVTVVASSACPAPTITHVGHAVASVEDVIVTDLSSGVTTSTLRKCAGFAAVHRLLVSITTSCGGQTTPP